jgi:hypothetical protein
MTVPLFVAGQILTADELDTLRSALGMTIPDFVNGQILTAAELNQLVAVANDPEVYGTATGGTGVTPVTIGGVDYNYTTFTSTGTLTVTKGGLFDILLFGGGGGGGPGRNAATIRGGSGGGGSGKVLTKVYITTDQTVTIGSGGAGGTDLGRGSIGKLFLCGVGYHIVNWWRRWR